LVGLRRSNSIYEGNAMTTFGQSIDLVYGSCGVQGCATRELALFQAVDLARHSGWHPRKWWEFWLPECSEDVRNEYFRQINEPLDDSGQVRRKIGTCA